MLSVLSQPVPMGAQSKTRNPILYLGVGKTRFDSSLVVMTMLRFKCSICNSTFSTSSYFDYRMTSVGEIRLDSIYLHKITRLSIRHQVNRHET